MQFPCCDVSFFPLSVVKENSQDSISGQHPKQSFYNFLGLPQSGEFSKGIIPISKGYY